jgi:hypothetical protein
LNFFKRVWLKLNPDISKEDFTVREDIACDDDCPVEVLEKLSCDDSHIVRFFVAQNASASPEILHSIAINCQVASKHLYCPRLNVAKNPNASKETLLFLHKEFPKTVLLNPNCPVILKVFT